MPKTQKTRDEMMRAGYKYDNHSVCRGCRAEIEWWITPAGRKMPIDLMPTGSSVWMPHHATCPDVASFRGKK